MFNSKNLEWIHTAAQKSLNLSLFEFKSYSEDVDKAIEKFENIIVDEGDYENHGFSSQFNQGDRNHQENLKIDFESFDKKPKKIFEEIFGCDKEYELEICSLKNKDSL